MLGITWEWGVIAVLCVLTIIFGEAYKFLKRRYLKLDEAHVSSDFICVN